MFLARLLKVSNRMKQLADRRKWRKELEKNAFAILSSGSLHVRTPEEISVLIEFCRRFRYFRNIKERVIAIGLALISLISPQPVGVT